MAVDRKLNGQGLLPKKYLIYIYYCMQTIAREYGAYKCRLSAHKYMVSTSMYFKVAELTN